MEEKKKLELESEKNQNKTNKVWEQFRSNTNK